MDAAANNIAINGALASEAPRPYNQSPSFLTLILPGTVSICPHKRILGKPEPFEAIKLPTSSILRSSHLSARKSANGFSPSEGVYNLSAFSSIFMQNLGVTVKEVFISYFDKFNTWSIISDGISTPQTLTVFLYSVVLFIS